MVIDYEKLLYKSFRIAAREIKELNKKSGFKYEMWDVEYDAPVNSITGMRNALLSRYRDDKSSKLQKGRTLVETAQHSFKDIIDEINLIDQEQQKINSKYDKDNKFGIFEYRVDGGYDAEIYKAVYKIYKRAVELVPKDTWNLAKSIKISGDTVYVDLDKAPYGLYIHEASAWRHTNGQYNFLFEAARETQAWMNNYINKRSDEYFIGINYYLSEDTLAVQVYTDDIYVKQKTDDIQEIKKERERYKDYSEAIKTSPKNYKGYMESSYRTKKIFKEIVHAKEREKATMKRGDTYDNEL